MDMQEVLDNSGGDGFLEIKKEVLNASKAGAAPMEEPGPAAFGSPAAPSPVGHLAKQLDFGTTKAPTEPTTPVTPFPNTTSADEVDYNQFIKDTLLWKNKVRSAFYLLSGLVAISGLKAFMAAQTSVVSAACYLGLLHLCFNFVRSFLSPAAQKRATWSDSTWTEAMAQRCASVVRAWADLSDRHMSTLQPWKTVQVAMSLWLLSLLGRYVSALSLVNVLYVAAFLLPALYTRFQAHVDKAITRAVDSAIAHFNRLDKRARAAVVVAPVLLLGLLFSWLDLAMAGFVLLAYLRAVAKPAEVEALSQKTVPFTSTVNKVSSRIGAMMEDAVARYELTPTPMKKKTQ